MSNASGESRRPDGADVSPRELAAMLARGDVQLIDIREPWEAALVSIEGSELIPLGSLGTSLDRVRDDVPVVLYCHHGSRSARALAALEQLGHTNVAHLAGGIDAYAAEVDPSLARY